MTTVTLNNDQVATVTDEFASLESADDLNGIYRYQFTLSISKSLAKNSRATKLFIRTYRENPKNAVSLSIFNRTPTQTLNILNQNSKILIQNIQSHAFSVKNQITDTRNKLLSNNGYPLPDLIDQFNHGVGYTTVTVDNPKDAIRNAVYPASNTLDQQPLSEDRTIPQLSLDLLKRFDSDPADTIRRVYSVGTSYESNNGLSSYSSGELLSEQNQILQSLLTGNDVQSIPGTVLQTYNVVDRDGVNILVYADLPSASVGTDDFYAMFSIYDDTNGLVQEFVKLVTHKLNLTMLHRIEFAPDFSLSGLSGGQFSMTLKQRDPYATGVKVYKTVYNSTATSEDAVQSLVGNYALGYGETRTFLLQNDSTGLLLFRALSYNDNASTSNDFTSQIVEVSSTELETSSKDDVFVSLNSSYVRGGLNLVISEIPDETSFIQLYKTNLTVDASTEILLTTFFVGGQGSGSSFSYMDSDLDKYKSYSYRVTLINNKGVELNSSAKLELYYRPQTQDYAVASYTAPVVTPIQQPGDSTQYYDVSFGVTYAITKTLEDNVKEFLTNQELIQYFGGDITRENLKSLLITKVELRDLRTNDKSFLTYMDSKFQQGATTYGLLNKNSQYVYELTTYVRIPATLLEKTVVMGSSTPRAGAATPPTYSYVPFNINNPYGLLQGTNPKSSGNEFVTQYGLDQLEFGDITGIDYISIDLKTPTPSINGLRAFMFNSKNMELNWSVNGDQNGISHFIIRRQNLTTGKLDLVGRAHGVNTQNNFSFIDSIRYTESGVFKYILTMQYFDMSLSPDYYSNQVVI